MSIDQPIKSRLTAYRQRDLDVETLTEEVERLKEQIIGIGAKEITGMPRSPSPPTDRIAGLVSAKLELEEEIKEIVGLQYAERNEIRIMLKQLRSADERAVIRFRYFLGLNWNDVTNAMFGAKRDYLGKEDAYLRRVYRLHGQALLHLEEITNGHRPVFAPQGNSTLNHTTTP